MKFANAVNGLVVQFIRLDVFEYDSEILVMERLYPLDFRASVQEKRLLWLDVFEDELAHLHKSGFVHRDLQRPSNMPDLSHDNIFLTPNGLRLIDVGISALKAQVWERLFERFVVQERAEFEGFREFFLAR